MDNLELEKNHSFPNDFQWGCATSAYQIEGAVSHDGRSPSIWDTFAEKPENVRNHESGDVACDHYHRFQEDIQLMADLGFRNYRFSFSWPRLMKEKQGTRNNKGFEFYDRLIDTLLKHDIQPFPTLYHWDLPQYLQDQGGWLSRGTVDAFRRYTQAVAEAFSDRVQQWGTINEPWCVCHMGHKVGAHAPGLQLDAKDLRQVIHHVLLSHGVAVQTLKDVDSRNRTGIVHNVGAAPPFTASKEDIQASLQHFYEENCWALDPLFKGTYPSFWKDELGDFEPDQHPEDLKVIATPTDFIGINLYSANGLMSAEEGLIPFSKDHPRTGFNWPIVPEVAYWSLLQLKEIYHPGSVYITENGSAWSDEATGEGQVVQDTSRIHFFQQHLSEINKALHAGVPVKGYYAWSFMDNFEWAEGYSQRFGLVHVDFQTLKRRPKLSAYWFSELMKRNALP